MLFFSEFLVFRVLIGNRDQEITKKFRRGHNPPLPFPPYNYDQYYNTQRQILNNLVLSCCLLEEE
jgi:hypothetical protein